MCYPLNPGKSRKEVEEGRFREDLFYRISVVPIDIKPLREHKTDIMPIARHYLDTFRKKYKSRVQFFSDEAVKSLMARECERIEEHHRTTLCPLRQ